MTNISNAFVMILALSILNKIMCDVAAGTEESKHISQHDSIIWTYIHDKLTYPNLFKNCIESWRIYSPNYIVVVLESTNINQYLDKEVTDQIFHDKFNFTERNVRMRVQLEILSKYGGVWLEPSTILFQHIDFIFPQIETFLFSQKDQMLRTWFMKMSKGNQFLQQWKQELLKAYQSNDIRLYLASLDENSLDKTKNLLDIVDITAQLAFKQKRFTMQLEEDRYSNFEIRDLVGYSHPILNIENLVKEIKHFDLKSIQNLNYLNIPIGYCRKLCTQCNESLNESSNCFPCLPGHYMTEFGDCLPCIQDKSCSSYNRENKVCEDEPDHSESISKIFVFKNEARISPIEMTVEKLGIPYDVVIINQADMKITFSFDPIELR